MGFLTITITPPAERTDIDHYGRRMVFDVARARRDTPGSNRVAHLNNAGAALPPSAVTEAVITHLRLEAEIGGDETAAGAAAQGQATHGGVSPLVGCGGDEVAVPQKATPASGMAFFPPPLPPRQRT